MQFAIDLDTEGPLTIDASCAIREHLYICHVCGYDAFLRFGSKKEAHFAHYRGSPIDCEERAVATSYSLQRSGRSWDVRPTLDNVTEFPATPTLFVHDGNDCFSSLPPDYPTEENCEYVYVAPRSVNEPPEYVKTVIRLEDFGDRRAWRLDLSDPVDPELKAWLRKVDHPLVRRAGNNEADRLMYIVASAVNADPIFGSDGTAHLTNGTYKLKITGAAHVAEKMKHNFTSTVERAIGAYCRARQRDPIGGNVKAIRASSGNLTLSCFVLL